MFAWSPLFVTREEVETADLDLLAMVRALLGNPASRTRLLRLRKDMRFESAGKLTSIVMPFPG